MTDDELIEQQRRLEKAYAQNIVATNTTSVNTAAVNHYNAQAATYQYANSMQESLIVRQAKLKERQEIAAMIREMAEEIGAPTFLNAIAIAISARE